MLFTEPTFLFLFLPLLLALYAACHRRDGAANVLLLVAGMFLDALERACGG